MDFAQFFYIYFPVPHKLFHLRVQFMNKSFCLPKLEQEFVVVLLVLLILSDTDPRSSCF